MTTIIDYMEQSLGPTDESTLVGQSLYKWGLEGISGDNLISIPLVVEPKQIEKLGLTYPVLDSGGNYPVTRAEVNGVMVNGIPFYAQYGKATHTIANQKQTITNFTTTELLKPRYHLASKIGGLYTHIAYSNIFHDFNLTHILGEPVSFSLVGMGYKQEFANVSLSAPTFPSTKDQPFDILNHVKWGADGSETALDSPYAIQFKSTQALKGIIGDDGYNKYIGDWSPIFNGIVIGFKTDNDSGLIADAHAKTMRSLLYKATKSSNTNHWFELDTLGDKALIRDLTPVKNLGQIVGWTAVIELESPTFVCQDYVADTFYEIPT